MHHVLTALLLTLALTGPAFGQGLERPGAPRPELPGLAPEHDEAPPRLPAVPGPAVPERARLSAGLRVWVREFRVVGSSVFSQQELAEVTAPYTGRHISSEELIEAGDAVTRLYVDRGYLSSSALIPDQRVEDGVVEIQVVEGTLADVSIEGTRYFRPGFLRSRVQRGGSDPLNVRQLEERLQLLQQDPRIRRVDARLVPGQRRAESLLWLDVEEESPWDLRFEFSNDLAPSLGGERTEITLAHRNLTGNGDTLRGVYSVAKGLYDTDLLYQLPIGPWDTRVELHYRHSQSEVVEDPFDALDIESERLSAGITVSQPVYRTPGTELLLGVTGELRRSEVEILDIPFSFFPSQLDDDGESRLSVLRLFSQWTQRSSDQVIAARVTASIGLDLFDATVYSSSRPGSNIADGRFASWLLQFQWARRLPERYLDSQLIFRTDLQLARDPLLPLERFSVGGRYTVRGYHENELVGDNGLVSSLELRIPVLRDPLGSPRLQVVPFFDFGKAWNEKDRASLQSIPSVGLGLRYALNERSWAHIYWGQRLRSVSRREGDDLQDAGIHFELRIAAF